MSRPDEGLIHAWLDGELDAAEAARVEALVKSDPAWAAAAAEARGFIAASARIVSALDHVPANVVPKPAPAAQRHSGYRGANWWTLRAAAALVIVAGTAVLYSRTSDEGIPVLAVDKDQAASPLAARSLEVRPAPSAAPRSEPPATVASGSVRESDSKRTNALADAAGPQKAQETLASASADQAKLSGAALAPQPAAPTAGLQQLAGQAPTRSQAQAPAQSQAQEARRVQAQFAQQGAAAGGTGAASALGRADASAANRAREAAKTENEIAATDAMAKVGAVECYRDPATNQMHRATRTSDSTATITSAPVDERLELRAAAARARPVSLQVKGDTLLVVSGNGVITRALKVSCSQP
jgi:hypothetical protein